MSHSALLLVGSPRGMSSNSHAIGRYLLDRLSKAGWVVDKEFIYLAIKEEEKMKQVLEKMDRSDLIVLSFPLYVDSLPSQMIRFLEQAHDHRKVAESRDQRMIAFCQSGFPESHHNDYALRICSIFAHDAGFHWAGGLSVGGGGAIGGRDLEETGGMMRKLRESLDLTANAIVGGEDIPERAKDMVKKGAVPPLLYNWVGNRHWKKEAKKNKVDLKAKPHA